MGGKPSLLEIVKLINPAYREIREQPIIGSSGVEVGWHSSVFDQSEKVVSTGTAIERDVARRIGIAEFVERSLIWQLAKDPLQAKVFGLDSIPCTSGFAAGFKSDSTRFRSLCEGLERWAWSQWIDGRHHLPEIKVSDFTPLAKKLIDQFLSVQTYQREVPVHDASFDGVLVFSVLVGFTSIGAFSGSRVTVSGDDLWTHAAVEAQRNHNNFLLHAAAHTPLKANEWLMRRIMYFGRNRRAAEEQIGAASKSEWPHARVRLAEGYEPYSGIFLNRTLFDKYIPWHEGEDNRFVY